MARQEKFRGAGEIAVYVGSLARKVSNINLSLIYLLFPTLLYIKNNVRAFTPR
jgi:hypothetical protein